MLYKIINSEFKIDKEFLLINNEPQKVTHATFKALTFFLQSNGKIVTKDELLKFVWGDVIVSDSSIFKQVELVRKLFTQASLPRDCIKTIYKKGYQLQYDIKTLQVVEEKVIDKSLKLKASGLQYFSVQIILVIVFITTLSLFLYMRNNAEQKIDFLDSDKRESLISLMKNNWSIGLEKIQEIIKSDSENLSKSDLGFLYGKQGRAHYHLLQYELSLESYKKALKFFNAVHDDRYSGKTHLNMAATLLHLPSIENYKNKQKAHILQALDLLKKSKSSLLLIDAQMELAHFYRGSGDFNKAIKLFEQTVQNAQLIKDNVGAMIANNNLASSYLLNNDYDKALEIAEQSLTMALEIGSARYIASSYSLLSDLYQRQYRSREALDMIVLAMKSQLSNNEFSNFGPKLLTLNYILVQVFDYKQANEVLSLTKTFFRIKEKNSDMSIISLYQGMNAARSNKWKEAETFLSHALEVSQKNNFKYKQSLTKAYLSLALIFNKNSLKSIEKAKEVINDSSSDEQSQAICALALAYSYSSLEKKSLSDKWLAKYRKSQNDKWLFENKLYYQLVFEQQVENSQESKQAYNKISAINNNILELTQSVALDELFYQELKQQLLEF